MKTKRPYLSAAVLGIVIAVALFLVLDVIAPAFSTSAVTWLLAPVSAPTPAPGDPIPLKSIDGLNSLNATVKLDVNGKIDGKKTKGDLNALLASNDQKKSQVTVSGSLLGQIAAQVGGSVLGMFTPSKVDLYKVPDGAYIAVDSLVPICVKPDTSDATAALDELSPSSMMNMLTNSDVARGKFVGDEKLERRDAVVKERAEKALRQRLADRRQALLEPWQVIGGNVDEEGAQQRAGCFFLSVDDVAQPGEFLLVIGVHRQPHAPEQVDVIGEGNAVVIGRIERLMFAGAMRDIVFDARQQPFGIVAYGGIRRDDVEHFGCAGERPVEEPFVLQGVQMRIEQREGPAARPRRTHAAQADHVEKGTFADHGANEGVKAHDCFVVVRQGIVEAPEILAGGRRALSAGIRRMTGVRGWIGHPGQLELMRHEVASPNRIGTGLHVPRHGWRVQWRAKGLLTGNRLPAAATMRRARVPPGTPLSGWTGA